MPLVLNIPGCWICLWFRICQVYTGFWICLNNSCICLKISDCAWIYMILHKSVRSAFLLHNFIVILCLLELVVTYFNKIYSLKEHKAIFLKKQNLIFSLVAGSICFVFCFKVTIFTSKISNLLILFSDEGAKYMNPNIPL